MRLALVLNPNAGTLRGLDPVAAAEDLAAIFRAEGHTIRYEIRSGRDAIAAIAGICAERSCEAIVVGGGDGTVSAAAAAAAANDILLGVLPLGTMNLFARSLHLPLDMRAAAEALARGREAAVDICEVNGRLFVHHLTLGLHPRMIRIRERMSYGSRLGKILANIQALLVVIRQPPRLNLAITVDGRTVERRVSVVAVSNNPFGEGHIPYADDLKRGKLGLYVGTSRRWTHLLQLATGLAMGDIAGNPQLESWLADEIEIRLPRPVITASVDGEIVTLENPLSIRMRHGGLRVIQPAAGPAELGQPGHVGEGKRGETMNETLNNPDARQGDRRLMNKTVVLIGTPLAFILLGILFWIWA